MPAHLLEPGGRQQFGASPVVHDDDQSLAAVALLLGAAADDLDEDSVESWVRRRIDPAV